MEFIDLAAGELILLLGFVALLGLCIGSFLNVVIYRLPIMMENAWQQDLNGPVNNGSTPKKAFNLAVPRSACPTCGTTIRWWMNIPIFGYILLNGRCFECKSRISLRYPIIEFATMVLSMIVVLKLGATPQAMLGLIVTWCLVALTMIDFDHQLLPDAITLPLMWLGLLVSLVPLFADVQSAVIGAAAGYMTLWLVYQFFRMITGKEGMGHGDFKLLAAIGALLGWQMLPVVILLSSLVGATVGILLIVLRQHDKNVPIPFGPYLAAAGWIGMLWGEELQQRYQGLFL